MKLTKLELSGFKSFADTVTLEFEDHREAVGRVSLALVAGAANESGLFRRFTRGFVF